MYKVYFILCIFCLSLSSCRTLEDGEWWDEHDIDEIVLMEPVQESKIIYFYGNKEYSLYTTLEIFRELSESSPIWTLDEINNKINDQYQQDTIQLYGTLPFARYDFYIDLLLTDGICWIYDIKNRKYLNMIVRDEYAYGIKNGPSGDSGVDYKINGVTFIDITYGIGL